MQVAEANGIDINKAWKTYTDQQKKIVLYGTGSRKYPIRYEASNGDVRTYNITWEGVINTVQRRYEQTTSDYMRDKYQQVMAERPCPTCNGYRLRPEAMAVTKAQGLGSIAARYERFRAITHRDGTSDCLPDFERDRSARQFPR
jgi:excinuclease ABC subunit A